MESPAALLRAAGLDVAIDVRGGRAADVIVEAALNRNVALIALASHDYSGLKRWTLGSVAHKVLYTTTPLILVRAAVALNDIPTARRRPVRVCFIRKREVRDDYLVCCGLDEHAADPGAADHHPSGG